jgi:hypothetical protein
MGRLSTLLLKGKSAPPFAILTVALNEINFTAQWVMRCCMMLTVHEIAEFALCVCVENKLLTFGS